VKARHHAAPWLMERQGAFLGRVTERVWSRAPPDVKAEALRQFESVSTAEEAEGVWFNGFARYHAWYFLEVMGPVEFSEKDIDDYWSEERSELGLYSPPSEDADPLGRFCLQYCVVHGGELDDDNDKLDAARELRQAAASALLSMMPPIERAAFASLLNVDPTHTAEGDGVMMAVLADVYRTQAPKPTSD
jgi:hypothetical protein